MIPKGGKVWQFTNQGSPYRSNNHDLDSPEVSNFNDKKMQSRAPEHGRQPLSWTYQAPCNVAWKPLPGFWPSEFRRSSLYQCNCICLFLFACNYPIRPIQTFQHHDQHSEVRGSRSMFHEICWTMWDLRHMSGLLVGFTVTADPEDCCDCRLECYSMIRENNEEATNQWEQIQMKSQRLCLIDLNRKHSSTSVYLCPPIPLFSSTCCQHFITPHFVQSKCCQVRIQALPFR